VTATRMRMFMDRCFVAPAHAGEPLCGPTMKGA
jgi:hypothetical protein